MSLKYTHTHTHTQREKKNAYRQKLIRSFLHRRFILRFSGTHDQTIKTSSDAKSREKQRHKGNAIIPSLTFRISLYARTYDRLKASYEKLKMQAGRERGSVYAGNRAVKY